MESVEGRGTAKKQAKEMPQSEIIFIIFYIYTHIYIFDISSFPAPILIHLEGSSDNLLRQECYYLLISRKRKLHASYF